MLLLVALLTLSINLHQGQVWYPDPTIASHLLPPGWPPGHAQCEFWPGTPPYDLHSACAPSPQDTVLCSWQLTDPRTASTDWRTTCDQIGLPGYWCDVTLYATPAAVWRCSDLPALGSPVRRWWGSL